MTIISTLAALGIDPTTLTDDLGRNSTFDLSAAVDAVYTLVPTTTGFELKNGCDSSNLGFEFSGLILGGTSATERALFRAPYQKGDLPLCKSLDGVRPITNPPKAQYCAACPMLAGECHTYNTILIVRPNEENQTNELLRLRLGGHNRLQFQRYAAEFAAANLALWKVYTKFLLRLSGDYCNIGYEFDAVYSGDLNDLKAFANSEVVLNALK